MSYKLFLQITRKLSPRTYQSKKAGTKEPDGRRDRHRCCDCCLGISPQSGFYGISRSMRVVPEYPIIRVSTICVGAIQIAPVINRVVCRDSVEHCVGQSTMRDSGEAD